MHNYIIFYSMELIVSGKLFLDTTHWLLILVQKDSHSTWVEGNTPLCKVMNTDTQVLLANRRVWRGQGMEVIQVISPWARKLNPPPPPPSAIFADMYHFKGSPESIWKMHVCTWLVGGCGCAATFFSSAESQVTHTKKWVNLFWNQGPRRGRGW